MYINYNILVQLLCPRFLRLTILLAILSAIAKAFQSIFDEYYQFRNQCLYDIQHTSQKCYVEAALNDAIDKYNRRIRVEDVEPIGLFICYAENEPIDVDINANTICYSSSIAGVSSVSFKVSIPAILYNSDQKRITIYNQAVSIVRKYKTIGRSFIVEFV